MSAISIKFQKSEFMTRTNLPVLKKLQRNSPRISISILRIRVEIQVNIVHNNQIMMFDKKSTENCR